MVKYGLIVIILAVFSFCHNAQAQSDDTKWKTIKYYDGSVFRGNVLSEEDGKYKVLLTTGDSIFLVKKLILNRSRLDRQSGRTVNKYFKEEGVFFSIKTNGYSEFGDTQYDLIVSKRLNKTYDVGLGTGWHQAIIESHNIFAEHIYMPLYVYGRRYLMQSKHLRPFIFTQGGYSFPLTTQNSWFDSSISGGMYAQPGFGLIFSSRGNVRLVITLSQYIQYTKGNQQFRDFQNNPVDVDYSGWHNNLILKIGIDIN